MTTTELGRLLEEIAEPVPEVAFAERAWRGAHVRRARARRRTVVAVAASVALLAGGYAWVGGRGDDRPVDPAQTTSTVGAAWRTAADGTRYVVAPALGTEQSVPWLDLGLPESIETRGPIRLITETARAKARLDVVAVYLEVKQSLPVDGSTHSLAVLVLRDGSRVVVSTADVHHVRDASGNSHVPSGVRMLSSDGQRLVFAQANEILVVDLATGIPTRVPVGDPYLEWAGWESGHPGTVIARSADKVWRVDLASGTPTRVVGEPSAAYEGAYSFRLLDTGVAGSLQRVTDGGLTEVAMPWPVVEPWGATTATTATTPIGPGAPGWVASGFMFDATDKGLVARGPVYQGIAAVQLPLPTTGSATVRLLAFGDEPSRHKGCCQVLGWSEDKRRLIYQSSFDDGIWIMAWDVETGEVRRVSRLAQNRSVVPFLALGGTFARD